METVSKRIYDTLEEMMAYSNGDLKVGDEVIVNEENGRNKYVIAHIGRKKIKLVRKEILMQKEMQSEDFDLLEWLDGTFKESLNNLNNVEIRKVTVPTLMNVFGETYWDAEPKGKQWEWFEEPANRIAISHEDNLSHTWWLRDVVSGSTFAFVYSYGHSGSDGASSTWVGVRPALSIYYL